MTALESTRPRAVVIATWVLQVLFALFFVVGSGAPKLFGESYAVEIFTEIGVGQWLRIVVGLLEVAGGIGLLVPRLAGLAALGLTTLMVFATLAQLFVLDTGFWFTPVIVGLLTGAIAWMRRDEIAGPGRGVRPGR